MSDNDATAKKITDAIDTVFGDQSRTPQDTRDIMITIRDHAQSCIDAITDDLGEDS
jgi:hypothetical protein